MAASLVRSSPWISLLGALGLLAGLIWDVQLHHRDPALAAREAVLSAQQPAHLVLALGVVLVVLSSLFFLGGRALASSGCSRWRRARRLLPGAAVFALSLVGLSSVLNGPNQSASEPAHADFATQLAQASPEQRAGAETLVSDTKAGAARFADFNVAMAEGYYQTTSFSLDSYGHAHYHNRRYGLDGRTLDPVHPENLVYFKRQNGEMVLLGAQYLAPRGRGLAPGGPLTSWHTHPELCVGQAGMVVRIQTPDQCPTTATLVGDSVEMLHVWIFDNPDGPFAAQLSRPALLAAGRQLIRGS